MHHARYTRLGWVASFLEEDGQVTSCRHLNWGGLELVGGLMKAGWRVHWLDLDSCGLYWPYLLPCYPLLTQLFYEDMAILHCA